MKMTYQSAGRSRSLQFNPMSSLASGVPSAAAPASARKLAARKPAARAASATGPLPFSDPGASLYDALSAIKKDGFKALHDSWNNISESDTRYMLDAEGQTLVIATDSIVAEGLRKSDLKHLRESHGFEVIREGSNRKLLLRSKDDTNTDALKRAQQAIRDIYSRAGKGAVAHPHFVRAFFRPKPSAPGGSPLWNHHNTGSPGVAGADVAAHACWLLTKGLKDIRVAVLDEGVDSLHPALKAAVVAELDVVDGNPHARPDGDDAHGTACAGIIASRDARYPGLAPDCSIVGVRIAKGDGGDGWIIDDYNTADAIDWSWEEGRADVLSNSWGGGPATDLIINAIHRARTKGRSGKGALVVFAAGNSNGSIDFPGSLDSVLTVGASNPWDQRKSPTSKDGENFWGSCYGKELDLLAPGVRIATTDISGKKGYSKNDFTPTFNGTSSATPHVAAAAALVLSVNPALKMQQVRDILTGTCDPLVPGGKWHPEYGAGRLNIFAAVRRALR
jgi:thermitase